MSPEATESNYANKDDCTEGLLRVLCGCHSINRDDFASFFRLMNGINPEMLCTDDLSIMSKLDQNKSLLENLMECKLRSTTIKRSSIPNETRRKVKLFKVGDEVHVSHGPALGKNQSKPAFDSLFYGPFMVTMTGCPCYEFLSFSRRVTCMLIDGRMLFKYGRASEHFLKSRSSII